jgi:GTP-binding protein
MNKTVAGVQHAFRTMMYAPVAFITAKTGRNVKALINLAQAMFKQANRRVGTGTLNRVLREAVEAHPPPVRENRPAKVYYATQVGTAPPTVVLFVNKPSLFDAPYQRYLLNVFRQKLPFKDIPIKLYLRARPQADPNAPRSGRKAEADAWVGDLDREVNDLLESLEE